MDLKKRVVHRSRYDHKCRPSLVSLENFVTKKFKFVVL